MNFRLYSRTDLQQVLNSQMSVVTIFLDQQSGCTTDQHPSNCWSVHLSAGCKFRYQSDLQNISESISGQKDFEISEIHWQPVNCRSWRCIMPISVHVKCVVLVQLHHQYTDSTAVQYVCPCGRFNQIWTAVRWRYTRGVTAPVGLGHSTQDL